MSSNENPNVDPKRYQDEYAAEDRLARLKSMNSEYREITGSDQYQYITQPGSAEYFVFSYGKISGQQKAETYMQWALRRAREGGMSHDDISAAYANFV